MRYGLVLSGGGALGSYQTGVIKAASESGLSFDLISGTSIGGLNGYMTAMGLIAELEEEWKRVDRFDLLNISPLKNFFFASNISLLKNDFQKKFLSRHLDYRGLKKARTELILTAACLQTGKLEYFSSRRFSSNDILLRALLATSAIPGVFPPVDIGKKQYVDGGILMNTPLLPLLHRNLDHIFIIHMTSTANTPQKYSQFSEVLVRAVNIFFKKELDEVLYLSRESLKEEEKYYIAQNQMNKLIVRGSDSRMVEFAYRTSRKLIDFFKPSRLDKKLPRIHVIHPKDHLPIQSYDFKKEKIIASIEIGYQDGIKFFRDFSEKQKKQIGSGVNKNGEK